MKPEAGVMEDEACCILSVAVWTGVVYSARTAWDG